MAYGFLVLNDSIGPDMDSDFLFCLYYRRLLMYDRSDVLHLQTPSPQYIYTHLRITQSYPLLIDIVLHPVFFLKPLFSFLSLR